MFILTDIPNELEITIAETDSEVYVRFPYDINLIARAKSVFPSKWNKQLRAWVYSSLIREDVYRAFCKECPPKHIKSCFAITEETSPFLLSHQRQCLEIARFHPKWGFFAQTGTGKTVIAYEIIKHKKDKTLIVAPLSTLNRVWIRIAEELYPDFYILPYPLTPKHAPIDQQSRAMVINLYPHKKPVREKIIHHDNGIHIINFEGFRIHSKAIMEAGYKMLILDESSCLKGRTTQISKGLVKFGQQVESAYLLSGTPTPNSSLEFYPAVDLIAPGLFGYSYYTFRNRFFHAVDRNGFTWMESKEYGEDFKNRLKKVCIFISKFDVLDLPERIEEERECEMTGPQRSAYIEMKEELMTEIEGIEVISPTVLSKIMKLRQISSGFIYHGEERTALRFASPKIDLLKEVLEEIGPQNQVIIWADFREEIEKIRDVLGDKCLAIYGGTLGGQDAKDEIAKDFTEGKFQYLVANPASIAHGHTFINCSYAVYYSLSYSSELWEQSRDRIYRYGQKNACTYIALLTKGTIDKIILRRVQKKIDGTKEILEHVKMKLGEETQEEEIVIEEEDNGTEAE